MIDRAKNKAAEEDLKQTFAQTRRLLAEAKKAAAFVEERDDLLEMIAEVVLTVPHSTSCAPEVCVLLP